MNAFEACRQLCALVREGMPRQSLITAMGKEAMTHRLSHISHARARVPRLSHVPPCLEEYDTPASDCNGDGILRTLLDAESELTVDFDSYHKPLANVTGKVARTVEHMRVCKTQQVQALTLLCSFRTDEPLRALLRDLPTSILGSIHTLCIWRACSTFTRFTSHAAPLFPYTPTLMFTSVTTLRLRNMSADLVVVSKVLPGLTSLELSNCFRLDRWEGLPCLTRLQDLAVSQLQPDAASDVRVWAAIRSLSHLHSVKLVECWVNASAALTGFTQLTSLSLGIRNMNITQRSRFQSDLDAIAVSSPDIRRLALSVPPGVNIPTTWTAVSDLYVKHKTVVPYLSSIRRLEIERTLTATCLESFAYHRLPPLPRNLQSLKAAYNALRSAVGCHELEHLVWTGFSDHRVFKLADHVALLAAVVNGWRVWPRLKRVLVLQESIRQSHCRCHEDNSDTHVRDTQIIYNAQLLETLACRGPPSCIEHVTLHQHVPGTGTFEALCKMPLCSVTLIRMNVVLSDLCLLLTVSTLRLLELIGVNGIDDGEMVILRDNARRCGCKVHTTEMQDLDVGTSNWPY